MSQPLEREAALLAEIPWMRQLARELVSDLRGREDLVQDTCWIALTQPPRAMDRTNLRAWLRKVLRSRSWLSRRSSGRNEAREQLVEGARVSEPVDELVARAELQRRLLAEVLLLRAPLREALLLRYYRGKDTQAIADQLGLSSDAVRQRISRAIAELRERTRDDRELRDLLWTVLPLKFNAAPAPRVLRWAAALCTALVAGIWIPIAISTAPSCSLPAPSVAALNETNPALSAKKERPDPLPNRAEIPPAVAGVPWLVLHIVDRMSGQPLSGATLSRARAKSWQELADEVNARWTELGIMGSAGRYLSLAGEEALPSVPGTENEAPFYPRDEAPLAKSDAEGRAAIEQALPSDEFLIIRSAGHAARFIATWQVPKTEADRGNALLEVQLHPTADLRVVVHSLDGVGVPEAFVRIEPRPYFSGDKPQASYPLLDSLRWNGPSEEDGSVLVKDLPVGEGLFATPLSRYIGRPSEVLLSTSSTAQEVRLGVVAPGSIRGRLVDAQEKPWVGARISCRPLAPWDDRFMSCMTDEGGLFEFVDLPAGAQIVSCQLPPPSGPSGLRESGRDLELQVEAFSRVDLGDLRDPRSAFASGRVIGFDAASNSRSQVRLHQNGKWTLCGLDANGGFSISGEPGKAFLEVLGPDVMAQLATLQLELPVSGLEFDVRSQLASLAFQIQGFGGADSKFSLRLYERDMEHRDSMPSSRRRRTLYEVAAPSDSVLLEGLPCGEFACELQTANLGSIWIDHLKLEGGNRRDLGRLNFAAARVRGSLAVAAVGVEVVARRYLFIQPDPYDFVEQAEDVRTPIDENGGFDFAALAPGPWCVCAMQGNSLASAVTYFEARGGSEVSILLPKLERSEVRCFVHRSGIPVTGAAVDVTFDFDQESISYFYAELNYGEQGWHKIRTDAEGLVLLRPMRSGGCQLSVTIGDQHCSRHVELAADQVSSVDFDLALSATEIELDLPPEWLEQISAVKFSSVENSGPTQNLELDCARSGKRVWNLRAPPCRGALRIELHQDSIRASQFTIPMVIAPNRKRQRVDLSADAVVLSLEGSGYGAPPPQLRLVAFSSVNIPDYSFDGSPAWPLERQADGTWIARGIAPESTLLITDRVSQPDGKVRERRVHFDGGRLELNWP